MASTTATAAFAPSVPTFSSSTFIPASKKCVLCTRASPLHRRAHARAVVSKVETFSAAASDAAFDTDDQEPEVPASEVDVRKLPIVAVVGRPNVGKSTLVNRLTGAFQGGSIVADVPGVTRDRTYRRAFWNGHDFSVVDTGGLVFDDDSVMLAEIRTQALVALKEASAAVLVVDARAGTTPLDMQLASFLRRECKAPVFIAVNKCESDPLAAADFWILGLGEPHAVSAIHGVGTGDLLDNVVSVLPRRPRKSAGTDIVNVAIVGRPNVGKSSLLNTLVGAPRAIVADKPGTTRDAVDEIIEANGRVYRLIDTAGIRRRGSVERGTEFYMVNRALRAIRRSDVVLLMVDVNAGAAEQDRKIADIISDEGRACVILANKWDLVEDKDNRSYKDAVDAVRERVVCIPWASVELISVVNRQRLSNVFTMVDAAREQHTRRVSTALLNEVLRDAVEWHRPHGNRGGRQGRIYYCTQVSVKPPTIAFFVNDPRLFTDNYKRYMEGRFRSQLGFSGTPIRILWRGKAKAPAGF